MKKERDVRRFSRGRWAVHRERARIADRKPEPDPRDSRGIQDVIPAVMKRFGLEEQGWQAVLEGEWTSLVGKAVAAHTRPGRMDHNNLVVFVDSSVWLNELSRYGRKSMFGNLQKRFGKKRIASVSLRLDPDGRAGKP